MIWVATFVTDLLKEKYGDDQEINIIYEDQPSSDYNTLFRRLHGMSYITWLIVLYNWFPNYSAQINGSFVLREFKEPKLLDC